jgi:hypothetical protein
MKRRKVKRKLYLHTRFEENNQFFRVDVVVNCSSYPYRWATRNGKSSSDKLPSSLTSPSKKRFPSSQSAHLIPGTSTKMATKQVAAALPTERLINAVVISSGLMEKTVKVRIASQKWNAHIRKVFLPSPNAFPSLLSNSEETTL